MKTNDEQRKQEIHNKLLNALVNAQRQILDDQIKFTEYLTSEIREIDAVLYST